MLRNKYLHVTLVMNFLHDSQCKKRLKAILLWHGFLYEPCIEFGWNHVMKEGGICHQDTPVWKVTWIGTYFFSFIITLSVILIISRGNILKFSQKLCVEIIHNELCNCWNVFWKCVLYCYTYTVISNVLPATPYNQHWRIFLILENKNIPDSPHRQIARRKNTPINQA